MTRIHSRALRLFALAALPAACAVSANAAILITEVHPTGSSAAGYGADFFELTNTGAAAVDITGWKIDDNSDLFSNSVALRGITSIPAGASVVFAEGNTSGSNDAAIAANFKTAWFGSNVPAGFLMGGYGGSGVGLSATADAVNIFDAGGALVTRVAFSAATTGVTFDNAAGASGSISTLSAVGVHGAFLSPNGEVGSPGVVPEPASFALFALAGLAIRRR